MSGWNITAQGGAEVDTWECYSVNETSSTSLIMIFKATATFTIFKINYVAFACLKMELFSDSAYYYYQMTGEETRLGKDRLVVYEQSVLSTMTLKQSDFCVDFSNSTAPTTSEYHIIIRNDKTESAIRVCPVGLQGYYKYTVTDVANTYCSAGNSGWNSCTNKDTITFNYTLCTTKVAYSEQGLVNCVFDLTSGTNQFVTVMTKEIKSDQRFTCFMWYKATNGTVNVSQFPGSCTKSQTPFSIPVSADGSITGFKIVLSNYTPCETTTTTTTSTTTTTQTTTTTTTPTTTSTSTTTTTTPTTTSTTTSTSTSTTTTPTSTSTSTTSTSTSTTPSTTSTSTSTTLSPSTTTIAFTTQTVTAADKTAVYIAIGAACVAGVLLTILIIIIVKRYCCRKHEPPPKTPDININKMPHRTAGYGSVPWGLAQAPRETTIVEEPEQEKDVIIFPQAKSNDFTVTMPRNSSFTGSEKRKSSLQDFNAMRDNKIRESQRSFTFVGSDSRRDWLQTMPDRQYTFVQKMSSVKVPTWNNTPAQEINPLTGLTTGSVKRSTSDIEITKTVNVFDGIIMDENVNFALRYSSRMKNVKKDWYERRNSGSSLVSEKVVSIPVGDGNNSRRVSITDIGETIIHENRRASFQIGDSMIPSYTNDENSIQETSVSRMSEVSLPVSPTHSVTG